MRILLIVAALVAVTMAPANSFAGQDAAHREAAQKFKTEMRDWFKTSVLPSLQKWHDEFDSSIPSDRLEDLNALRVKAKAVRESMHAEMRSLRESAEDGSRKDLREKVKALKKEHHSSMKEIMKELRPIATDSRDELRAVFEDHKDEIQSLKKEARDKVKAFKAEMKSQRDQDGERERRGEDCRRGRRSKRHGMKDMGGLEMLMQGGRKAAVRFLLWDGSEPVAPQEFNGTTGVDEERFKMGRLSVAPNPSGTNAQVNINNVPGTSALIEVFDMNGSLMSSKKVAVANGNVSENISTLDLPAGSYIISVNSGSYRQSSSLIVNR